MKQTQNQEYAKVWTYVGLQDLDFCAKITRLVPGSKSRSVAEVENAGGVGWGMDGAVPEGALSHSPSGPPGRS